MPPTQERYQHYWSLYIKMNKNIMSENHDSHVTVVVSRRIKKGAEELYELLSGDLTHAAATFSGYLGAVMFRPSSQDDPEYRIIYKFNNEENLNKWLKSSKRSEILNNIESLLEEPSELVGFISSYNANFHFIRRYAIYYTSTYKDIYSNRSCYDYDVVCINAKIYKMVFFLVIFKRERKVEIKYNGENMKLIVNRKEMEFKEGITLHEVIEKVKMGDKVMGAAVNGRVVTVCDITKTKLKEGDKINLLPAMAAG